jgi:hypothetical protein
MVLKHKASLGFTMPEPFSFELTVNKPSWIGLMVPGEVVPLDLSLRDVDYSQLLFQG